MSNKNEYSVAEFAIATVLASVTSIALVSGTVLLVQKCIKNKIKTKKRIEKEPIKIFDSIGVEDNKAYDALPLEYNKLQVPSLQFNSLKDKYYSKADIIDTLESSLGERVEYIKLIDVGKDYRLHLVWLSDRELAMQVKNKIYSVGDKPIITSFMGTYTPKGSTVTSLEYNFQKLIVESKAELRKTYAEEYGITEIYNGNGTYKIIIDENSKLDNEFRKVAHYEHAIQSLYKFDKISDSLYDTDTIVIGAVDTTDSIEVSIHTYGILGIYTEKEIEDALWWQYKNNESIFNYGFDKEEQE